MVDAGLVATLDIGGVRWMVTRRHLILVELLTGRTATITLYQAVELLERHRKLRQ